MTFDELVISDGIIIGKGSDEVGEFYINGYVKGTKINFIKKYHGKHTVLYKGHIDDKNVIKGKWQLEAMEDNFELRQQNS